MAHRRYASFLGVLVLAAVALLVAVPTARFAHAEEDDGSAVPMPASPPRPALTPANAAAAEPAAPVTPAPTTASEAPPAVLRYCGPVPGQTEYALVGSDLSFVWAHPLRPMQASNRAMRGSLEVNLAKLSSGMHLQLQLPMVETKTTDMLLAQYMGWRLETAPKVEVAFDSRNTRLADGLQPLGQQMIVFSGDLSVTGGIVLNMPVPIAQPPVSRSFELPLICTPEESFIRCAGTFVTDPSWFVAEFPGAYGIYALDRLMVAADMTFAPRKER